MDKKTSHLENNKHLSLNTHYSAIYRESLLQENQLLLYLPNLVPSCTKLMAEYPAFAQNYFPSN